MKTHPLYLNGQFVEMPTSIEVINPATEEAVGKIGTVDLAKTKQAMLDAQAAFEPWAKLTAMARADYLLAIAGELNKRKEEIAKVVVQENGKPLGQGRGEVAMSVDHLRWFAEEGRRAYGRWVPHQANGKRTLVIKNPVGVVGAISPWNFPLILAVRKIAPALAAGCPVILKPASQTPLCAFMFAEACHAVKLPKGVFQMVLGDPKMIADEMLNNRICQKITFTGSTEVGRTLIRGAANDIKKLSLELGGHAPLLVFDDADLDRAVEGALAAKFRNTGQSCIAANRIYVQSGIYERFVKTFVERTKAMKVGNGLEEGVEVGPMVNLKGLNAVLAQIEDAVKRGAKVVAGGKRMGSKGFFLEATVLTDVHPDSVCMSEETFAPMAPIVKFGDEVEGIRMANNSVYGLSAYAFTNNLDRAFRVMEKLDAGTVGINDGVPSTSNAPFGGTKHSGWGRELGSEGIDAFMETKHVSFGMVE